MHAVGAATQTVELTVRADRSPGIVDITDVVARHVSRTAIVYGIAHVFCRHTTCGVLVNELEDGLAEDLAAAMARLVPERYFAHDDMTRRTQNLQGPDERPNGSARQADVVRSHIADDPGGRHIPGARQVAKAPVHRAR